MKRDLPLVAALAAVGLLMGALTIFNLWPLWVEPLLWVAIAAALWVPFLVRKPVASPFLSGFLVSLLAGLFAAVVHVPFAETYLANHPDVAAQYAGITGAQLKLLFLGSDLLNGALFGLLVGLATWLLLRRRAAQAPA
ncbi:MAG TPA: hypothetical protein VNZ52_14550 [Candidatus Thermoplasmatota archaeon]|nr:hypothetical protein [Candidatus Thermoplasmatota archaeon]